MLSRVGQTSSGDGEQGGGAEGIGIGTGIIPHVEVQLENFKDGSSSFSNVLLVNIIKG